MQFLLHFVLPTCLLELYLISKFSTLFVFRAYLFMKFNENIHPTRYSFISAYSFIWYLRILNTSSLTDSYIVFNLKIESVSKTTNLA